jgi:YidC/Oxa1 family membrane protein insertase
MNFFGMDLSLSASEALSRSVVTALPYLAALLIILATGLYQNRQMQARNTSGNVNPQQQMIMRFMPFFLPIFSFGFPAGLALYWCTQNLCRIGTNAYITRSLYKKEHEHDAEVIEVSGQPKKEPSGKGKQKPEKKAVSAASSSSNAKRKGATTATAAKAPGKSVKSQMAHQKRSGQGAANGASSSAARATGSKTTSRRSGEARRGSGDQKK